MLTSDIIELSRALARGEDCAFALADALRAEGYEYSAWLYLSDDPTLDRRKSYGQSGLYQVIHGLCNWTIEFMEESARAWFESTRREREKLTNEAKGLAQLSTGQLEVPREHEDDPQEDIEPTSLAPEQPWEESGTVIGPRS